MTQRYIDIAFDDATPRSFGGFDNENEATVIRLKVLTSDAKYYLEIERACAKHDKYCSDALPVADGYAVFEVPRDFTHETLYVQGVMKVDGMCRKTARVRVGFSRSINALDELPESHPSWADSIEKQLGNLDDLTTKDKGSLVAAINETAKSGGGAADAVTYTPQNLTEEQQEQARENITVAKSYQIPTTTINDNEVRVDGWAAVPIGIGRPSGFSIILSDVLNGALPFFVANGTVFLCTGVDSSGADKVLTFVGFASSDSLSAITYKNARWKDGLQVIYIYPGSVDPNDIDYCAKVTYYYVGSYGYIYGPSYKELMEERDFAVKHPLAVVNGKFDNAILPLTCVDDVNKSITYVRIDVLPSGAHQIRGLTIADGQPLHIIDLTTPPPYTVPASGIPKSDLAEDVQTSLAKADTAISLGLTAATPGQIIKVKAVQDGKPTEWEAVDMPGGGETWEKVADIELRADTALYVLADFAVWRKAKVIMRRPTYVSGLAKNVWCRVVEKNNVAAAYYSCGYLVAEYGYSYWDFSAEVSSNVISSATLRNNNTNAADNVRSTQTLTPINLPPTAYELTLTFVDTSVIQDGDKVTVIGVRR
nr:MAG TPA: hypothetical protein [Caudoviricetes sp.]